MHLLQLYSEHCHSLFQRQQEQSPPCPDRFIKVADRITIRLRFAGQHLVRPILRSLAHLETTPVENADLTICIWDSSSARESVPPYPSWTDRIFSGTVRNGPFQIFCSLNPNMISVFDAERNSGLFWIEDISKLPWYEQSRALRDIIRCYCLRHGLHMIHAACVGRDNAGVIIVGGSGAGKSTSALSFLSSDLRYVADDLCLVGADGRNVRAYSLYNTGKLDHLSRLPHLQPHVSNPQRISSEKAVIFVHEEFPEKVATSVPVSAILLSSVTDSDQSALTPISRDVALRSLVKTTAEALIDVNVKDFFALYKVCSNVPCYSLECGSDLQALHAKLVGLMDDISQDSR